MTGLLIITTPTDYSFTHEEARSYCDGINEFFPRLFVIMTQANDCDNITHRLITDKKQIRTEHKKLKRLIQKVVMSIPKTN